MSKRVGQLMSRLKVIIIRGEQTWIVGNGNLGRFILLLIVKSVTYIFHGHIRLERSEDPDQDIIQLEKIQTKNSTLSTLN